MNRKIRRGGMEIEAIPEEIDQPVQSVFRDSRSLNDQLRSVVSSNTIRNIDFEQISAQRKSDNES